ncbi:glutamine-binding protein, partial [Acinetobacter baumannii]
SDTYFTKHYPKVNLLKFERNSDAVKALTDGRGDAISQDSTYALAWAAKNPSYVAGIQYFGDQEFIAPAVKKGDKELLDWLNQDLEKLAKEGVI